MNEAEFISQQWELTSNEFYGWLNAQFDDREKVLIAAGYKRETLSAYNLAFYVKIRHGRTHAIPAATLHHASERAWSDIYEECKRFALAY